MNKLNILFISLFVICFIYMIYKSFSFEHFNIKRKRFPGSTLRLMSVITHFKPLNLSRIHQDHIDLIFVIFFEVFKSKLMVKCQNVKYKNIYC